MILKTYARVVTGDTEATLTILRTLTAKDVDLRFTAGEIEIAAVGNFCIIAAPLAQQGALREVVGPVVVDDLRQTRTNLLKHGAVILRDSFDAPTGTVLYARNKDGVIVEWLQFSAEYLEKTMLQPLQDR